MGCEKELKYIFKRKVFKTHIFHNNNIEEEYHWDDYDTTYGYKINTEACCLPNKPVSIEPVITQKLLNVLSTYMTEKR